MWWRNVLNVSTFFITGSYLFLLLSYGVRTGWSQGPVAFTREIKLIIAATKNSQIPQINMTQCDFLMCGDVLTDTLHLRGIWGNAFMPPGGLCKTQRAESASFKKQLLAFGLYVRLTLQCCSFSRTSSQGPQWQGWHWRSRLKAKLRRVYPGMSASENSIVCFKRENLLRWVRLKINEFALVSRSIELIPAEVFKLRCEAPVQCSTNHEKFVLL